MSFLCIFTLLTPTENTVLDRKGFWALKSFARLVAVAVHVLHNLVRQLSKNLMDMVVMVIFAFMTVLTYEARTKIHGVLPQGGLCWKLR